MKYDQEGVKHPITLVFMISYPKINDTKLINMAFYLFRLPLIIYEEEKK